MFTRQKKNYRTFVYVALIIMLCILIVALMWPKEAEPSNNDVKTGTNVKIDSDKDKDKDKNNIPDNTAIDKPNGVDTDVDNQKPVVDEKQETYYVVKRKDDKISVFFSNERGEEIELETTDIVYDLLTPEDQRNFDEGIKAKSQEELSSILQDFES